MLEARCPIDLTKRYYSSTGAESNADPRSSCQKTKHDTNLPSKFPGTGRRFMLTYQSVLTSCNNTGPKREGKKKRLSRSQAVYTHLPCDSLPASFVCAMVGAAGLRDSASSSSAEFGHLATPACGKGTERVDGGTAEQHRTRSPRRRANRYADPTSNEAISSTDGRDYNNPIKY
ncbi:hypothetical protein CDAR_93851 [Caerostris darwini]|uniref:Uncharacterized protein n=1 Tax=Caerostris darwini TaxID=1538125 RepID=A0AAV4NJS9_9ARAC|nr:hypothetical protein CDAR_93851 [Caerostris darwini]